MTATEKVSGKSAALRTLLIKAWRERWSASQYGTQVKALLGRGVSGDVYGLADSLINQALTGPSPNQLMLSLLQHSLATQLVSHAATLATTARFTVYSKPHCTAALLDLILSQSPYLTCRGRPEECVTLSVAMLAVAVWILRTTAQTVARLVDLRESPVDNRNLVKCKEIMEWMTKDNFVSCLLTLAKQEDQDLQQELYQASKMASKASDQIYMFTSSTSNLQAEIANAVQAIRNLDPSVELSHHSGTRKSLVSLTYTLHSMLAFEAVLHPTSDLNQLAGQLATIQSIKSVSLPEMICEVLHCCLLAMNEHDGFEVFKWDAFTLIKMPSLVDKLVKLAPIKQEPKSEPGTVGGEVFKGLLKLLDYQALLDMTDARCRSDTFELVAKSMFSRSETHALITEPEYTQLIETRKFQLETRKNLDLKMDSAVSRDVPLILKADQTIASIIQTFENRTTDQSEFENLLSIFYHIVKGHSSFDLLLSASAANENLDKLITKLLFFNEACKESVGESNKGSQSRAALFDMTFLMLVYAVQCFGSDVVLANAQPGFFVTWARECMVEPARIKPLSGFSEQESQVDGLLQQINTGEIRTQVIKWHNVCANIHGVMREIILGVEMNAINMDKYNRLMATLGSRLCSLPVCIVSWLSSYSHYSHDQSPSDGAKAVTPVNIADRFLSITSDSEEPENLPYYTQRCSMMVNIMKRMREEFSPGNGKRVCEALAVELGEVWDRVWAGGRLNLADTRKVAGLAETGGSVWFVEVLVGKMAGMVYNLDVDRAVEVVFSMMHVDMPACMLALVLHILPKYLASSGQEERLAHPAGSALARLTVMTLAAALRTRGPTLGKRSARAAQLDDLCNSVSQPVKLSRLTGQDTEATMMQPELLLEQAHVGLFQLLAGLGVEPVVSPRTEFVCSFLEQCVLAGKEQARLLLAPAPVNLIIQLVKLQPSRFSMELILYIYDLSSSSGRKNVARILCMLRNIRAKKEAAEPEL